MQIADNFKVLYETKLQKSLIIVCATVTTNHYTFLIFSFRSSSKRLQQLSQITEEIN